MPRLLMGKEARTDDLAYIHVSKGVMYINHT